MTPSRKLSKRERRALRKAEQFRAQEAADQKQAQLEGMLLKLPEGRANAARLMLSNMIYKYYYDIATGMIKQGWPGVMRFLGPAKSLECIQSALLMDPNHEADLEENLADYAG